MNRIKKLLLVVLLSSVAGVTPFAQNINKTDVKSIMKRVADWQIANPNKDAEHDDLDWTHAALYMGMVDWADLTEREDSDSTYYKWLLRVGQRNHFQVGKRMYHADFIAVGQPFIDLYIKYGNKKMIAPVMARANWIVDNPAETTLELDYRKSETLDRWSCFGEFNFNTNFVFSYAKNKVEFNAEAQQRYDWLSATGRPIGQPFGYTWIGYYTPEEVDLIHAGAANAPAVPNTDVPIQAGDLKYKDLNGDGVINDFDKGAIGKPNLPNTTLGWTIGGSWKGLSVSVLFQGSFNYSFSVNGTGIEPFKSQFQPLHQKRWTLERYLNGEAIEFPRLTSNPSTVNSAAAYMSDFWLIDAWYIRLKTIDVSYQVPTKVLPSWLTNLRVYLNAYNMFTWTSFDKYQQDPEIKSNSAGDAYMNQRVFNLGVQLTF